MRRTVLRNPGFAALTCCLVLAGCGGSGGSSAGTLPPPSSGGSTSPAISVYVTQDNDAFAPPQPSTLLQFAKTSNGSVAPVSTITGPANVIFQSTVEDPAGNLYVAGLVYNDQNPAAPSGPGSIDILEYAAGSSGRATPLRNITGTQTGLELLFNNPIQSIDLDAVGNLYVEAPVEVGTGRTGTIDAGISVFAPTANGNAAPTRVIAGDRTGMSGSAPQIAVAPDGTVYVPSQEYGQAQSILIFAPAATGNVAPTSMLGGAATTMYTIKGVALDGSGNIFVASLAKATSTSADSATPSILEFAAGSTGNTAPIRMISGAAAVLGFSGNLRVDKAGTIYAISGSSILEFAPSASGNVAPAAAISSSAFFSPDSSLAVR